MSGGVLHHVTFGPADAPPLVFLHGFLGRAQDWEHVAAALAGQFRCICLDLPGHGKSVGLRASSYEWWGALDAVAASLEALGVERCRMVGYSMGGRLALGFALRHTRRVARLVLLGASPGIRDEDDRRQRVELDDDRASAIVSDLRAFVRVWYRMPVFASLGSQPRLLEALGAEPGPSTAVTRLANDPVELAHALRGLSTGRMPSYWEHLDGLGAPSIAAAGSLDRKFADLAFGMAAAGLPIMPRLIAGAGHMLHLERPDAVAGLLRDFCADALLQKNPEASAPSARRAIHPDILEIAGP